MVGPQKMRGGVSEETDPVGPSELRGREWRRVHKCNRNLVEDLSMDPKCWLLLFTAQLCGKGQQGLRCCMEAIRSCAGRGNAGQEEGQRSDVLRLWTLGPVGLGGFPRMMSSSDLDMQEIPPKGIQRPNASA